MAEFSRTSAVRLVVSCLAGMAAWCGAPLPAAKGAPPEPAKPELAKVVELDQHRRCGVVSAWLENGVRVHYRALPQPPGQAVLTISLFGGELLEDESTRGLSRLSIAALDDRLNAATAPPEIKRALGARDVRVDGLVVPDSLMLRVSGSAGDVGAAARLVGGQLREPALDAESIARARAAVTAETEKATKSGAALVARSLVELIYPPTDPRTRLVRDVDLGRFGPADVAAWLARHVGTGEAGTGAPVEASVVGDVSLEQALAMARDAVGMLPARARVAPGALAAMRRAGPPNGPLERTVVTGTADGRAYVAAGFLGIDITVPSQVRLFRAAGRVLQARVRERLETAGLTTRPEDCDAGVWLSPDPGYGMLIMLARVDPGQAQMAGPLLNDEVDRLSIEGPTPEELRNAAEGLAIEAGKSNLDPHYWSGMLARVTAQGVDPDEVYMGPEFYRGLTPERVLEAVRELWKPESRFGLVIGPRAGGAGAP